MLNLLSHLRYAARQFRGSPVFTAAAVLTLALGIGGTTAIFTLMGVTVGQPCNGPRAAGAIPALPLVPHTQKGFSCSRVLSQHNARMTASHRLFNPGPRWLS